MLLLKKGQLHLSPRNSSKKSNNNKVIDIKIFTRQKVTTRKTACLETEYLTLGV